MEILEQLMNKRYEKQKKGLGKANWRALVFKDSQNTFAIDLQEYVTPIFHPELYRIWVGYKKKKINPAKSQIKFF